MARWDEERRWGGRDWGDEERGRYEGRWRGDEGRWRGEDDRWRAGEDRWRGLEGGREGGREGWRRQEGWRGEEDLRPGERRGYVAGRGERDDRWRETAREQEGWRDRDRDRDYERERDRIWGRQEDWRPAGYRGDERWGAEYRGERGQGDERRWTGEERRPDTLRSSWGIGGGPGAMGGFGETAGFYGLGHAYDLSGRSAWGGEGQRSGSDWSSRGGSGGAEGWRDRDRDRGESWWDRMKDEGRRIMGRGEQRHGRGPKGYRRSDERIHDDVCERIARSAIDADSVEVKVSGGEVTLSGQVRRREDKRELEDLAEEVFGVDSVQNNLRVDRGEQRSWGSSPTREAAEERIGASNRSAGTNQGASGTAGTSGTTGATGQAPSTGSGASQQGGTGSSPSGAGRH
ncbi:MAG: BON domain-containing protein [Anaeromyxobacter sp.]